MDQTEVCQIDQEPASPVGQVHGQNHVEDLIAVHHNLYLMSGTPRREGDAAPTFHGYGIEYGDGYLGSVEGYPVAVYYHQEHNKSFRVALSIFVSHLVHLKNNIASHTVISK